MYIVLNFIHYVYRAPSFFPSLLLRSSSDVGVYFNKKKSMPVTTICWVSSKYHGDTHTYINRGGITLFPLASSVPWTPTPPDAVVLDAFPMVRSRILFFLFLPFSSPYIANVLFSRLPLRRRRPAIINHIHLDLRRVGFSAPFVSICLDCPPVITITYRFSGITLDEVSRRYRRRRVAKM